MYFTVLSMFTTAASILVTYPMAFGSRIAVTGSVIIVIVAGG